MHSQHALLKSPLAIAHTDPGVSDRRRARRGPFGSDLPAGEEQPVWNEGRGARPRHHHGWDLQAARAVRSQGYVHAASLIIP